MRTLLVLFLVATTVRSAAAHMVVVPEESEAGGWEHYSLIVPTEKKSATVRVELKLPAGIDVMGIESKAGWKGVYAPFPLGAARVEWSGGSIPPGELLTFDFLVWNPKTEQTLTWDATQWYEDGSSDRWGTPGDEKRPASQTTLRPSSGGGHEHHRAAMEAEASRHAGAVGSVGDAPSATHAQPTAARSAGGALPSPATASDGGEKKAPHASAERPTATMLSAASLVISLLALVVAARGRGGAAPRR